MWKIVLDAASQPCFYPVMSAAFATTEPPNRPDPTPDPAAGSVWEQSRTSRLLGLLRKLIDYGLELSCSLQQNPAVATLIIVARHFGTRDIALLLSRITRGLQLAGSAVDRGQHLARPASRPHVEEACA